MLKRRVLYRIDVGPVFGGNDEYQLGKGQPSSFDVIGTAVMMGDAAQASSNA
jgi:hypothetical protein